MSKLKSFFALIRWPNLLLIAVMMLLVYYCLMSPLSLAGIIGIMPPSPAFLLLLVSMVFIVAAGYVINDFFDSEIDRINKPDRLIVSKIFSEKETKFFYVLLTILGLSAGFVSSVLIAGTKFLTLFAILILLVALLYSYSSTYKRKLFVGNIIVSISVAFAVFLPWLFEMIYLSNNLLMLSVSKELVMGVLPYVLVYTAFAFLMTMIREIVKDAEDMKGDLTTHCRTIPIVLGVKKMNAILHSLMLVLYVVLFNYLVILFKSHLYVAFGIISVVTICVCINTGLICQAKDSAQYHRISTIMKVAMLMGVISMIFV